MDEDWLRDLRAQSVKAGIAFFYKQKAGASKKDKSIPPALDGKVWTEIPYNIKLKKPVKKGQTE